VKVLQISGQFSPVSLPGNGGQTLLTPSACITPVHWAGPGETAVLHLSATASPTNPVTDVLYVLPMVSKGLAPFARVALPGSPYPAEGLQDGTANASVEALVPLTEGLGYVFGVGVGSNNKLSLSPGYCTGTVQIIHT
jgi:hypothetical protein